MESLFAKRLVKTMTPDTRRQSVIAFIIVMIGIIALNFWFHAWFAGGAKWPAKMIALNAVLVGGPFALIACVIGMLQVNTLRDLSLRSRKDGLTNLNNRRTFMRLAQQRLASQPRGMLLLLDADHFKRVNDTYGHAVGDACLVAISRHLQWNLREDDVAGRIGGEEFAIYLANVGLEQARAIGTRLTQPIPFKNTNDNDHLCITLSIGGAMTDTSTSLDRLLIFADNALYAAKEAGRACLIIYDKDEHETRGKAA